MSYEIIQLYLCAQIFLKRFCKPCFLQRCDDKREASRDILGPTSVLGLVKHTIQPSTTYTVTFLQCARITMRCRQDSLAQQTLQPSQASQTRPERPRFFERIVTSGTRLRACLQTRRPLGAFIGHNVIELGARYMSAEDAELGLPAKL